MERKPSPMLIFKGEIMAKPRMTRSDKWKERIATSKYWAFKDHLTLQANIQGFTLGNRVSIKVDLPMPKSWSKKKREEMNFQPHQQKPDIDNIIKSVQDILMKEDSTIYEVCAVKRWTSKSEGLLIIKNVEG